MRLERDAGSRTCRPVDAPPRHRNFEALCAFSRPLRRAVDAVRDEPESSWDPVPAVACPALTTGRARIPLFNRKTAALFSDLLLHDVGTAARQQGATPKKFERLGLRAGRCSTTTAWRPSNHSQIKMRALARQGIRAVPADDRQRLLAFLVSKARALRHHHRSTSTSSFEAALAPIVMDRRSFPRSRTESAAASRVSTSTD